MPPFPQADVAVRESESVRFRVFRSSQSAFVSSLLASYILVIDQCN